MGETDRGKFGIEKMIGQRFVRILVIIAALLAASIPALAAQFSDQQRQEIGKIVREYLLNNPELMREVLQELEKKQAAEDSAKLKVSLKENADAIFRSSADLVAGNPEGHVTMVEFFDYNC